MSKKITKQLWHKDMSLSGWADYLDNHILNLSAYIGAKTSASLKEIGNTLRKAETAKKDTYDEGYGAGYLDGAAKQRKEIEKACTCDDPPNDTQDSKKLSKEKRIQTENDAASQQALIVLREVIRCSRDISYLVPLPRDVFDKAVYAAMELSRCGFEETTD